MNTHRTTTPLTVATSSGYRVESRTVPAGTEGVIEYCGVIGGVPCVVFRGGGMEMNLIGMDGRLGRNAAEVERIPEIA